MDESSLAASILACEKNQNDVIANTMNNSFLSSMDLKDILTTAHAINSGGSDIHEPGAPNDMNLDLIREEKALNWHHHHERYMALDQRRIEP